MSAGSETSPSPTAVNSLWQMEVDMHCMSNIKGKLDNSRKRFNNEQIKLLETMFETETRPELQVKQQLAKKLGLQPRQVAIWFQNKRARSKSKQLERDYKMLKLKYDNLASKYESLKRENQSLLTQFQRLTEKANHEEGQKKKIMRLEQQLESNFQSNAEFGIPSYDEDSEKADFFRADIDDFSWVELADHCFTPAGSCDFEPNCLLDNPSCGLGWWII